MRKKGQLSRQHWAVIIEVKVVMMMMYVDKTTKKILPKNHFRNVSYCPAVSIFAKWKNRDQIHVGERIMDREYWGLVLTPRFPRLCPRLS